jgi:hypothetical protein
MSDENKEEINQADEIEEQKLLTKLQRQIFSGTQQTPTPLGLQPQGNFEIDPQEQPEGYSPYDQAFINQLNLIGESFFLKGRANRYVKYRAENDLIEAYENKRPLPDYTKISLTKYFDNY